MRALMTLPAIAALCGAQAQQIDAYRYWFDDQPATAVLNPVSPTDELLLSAAWPTTGLVPGYHRASVQVRDTNGEWSVPLTQYFTRGNQAITGYRYWVNDNPANSTTAAISPNAVVDLNSLIDPGTLPNDYNTVTIQFHDADGEWSAPYTTAFVKNAGEVNGYEYWIDDAIASRTAGTIGPDNVVDLIADLPTGVGSGDHVFTIRFSGAGGSWSVPLTSAFSFYTSVDELPGLSDLLLFPNPTNGELALRLTSANGELLRLAVLDATGRVVRAEVNWAPSGSAVRTWDLADLAPGAYSLRITNGASRTTLKFQKT